MCIYCEEILNCACILWRFWIIVYLLCGSFVYLCGNNYCVEILNDSNYVLQVEFADLVVVNHVFCVDRLE